MATRTMVTLIDNDITKTNDYTVFCPLYGCEYSANAGDYWQAIDAMPMTCEHDGEQVPCNLIQKAIVGGKTSEGQAFYGSVRLLVIEGVTVGDLRNLKGGN